MSEIRVTNVIGENGDSPVNFTKGINMSGICTAPAFIPSQGQLSHRNIVINGAMTVAQRGVSSSAGNGYHTVDRIKFRSGGNDEANTVSRIVLSSSDTGPYEKGFRYAYRMQNGNQTSVGTGDWAQIEYHPEAQDIANSGWDYTNPNSFITLSFWTRSSVGQRFYGYMDSIDGTGQRYSFATDGGSALSANTWRFVSVTIPGNSNLQFDNNSDNGLDIKFVTYYGTSYTDNSYTMNNWAATGSNYMHDFPSTWYTTNDATWDITGIQLEVGSVATPFEHRSYGEELIRCKRYFNMVADGSESRSGSSRSEGVIGNGFFWQSTRMMVPVKFQVAMRTPDWTLYKKNGEYRYYANGSSHQTCTQNDIGLNGQDGLNSAHLNITNINSSSAAGMFFVHDVNAALGFDAEL